MTFRLAGNADPKRREVYELADALLGGTLTRAQAGRLETLVSGDVEARRHYVRFMHDSALLNQWGRDAAETGQVAGTLRVPSLEQLFSVAADPAGDAAVQPPRQVTPDSPIFLSPLPPSLSTTHYPLSTNFVGGPVFSYIAATLILGVMLLGAWAYTITHDYGPSHAINSSFAKNSRGLTAPGEPAQRPELIFVARVTGMKDCRWSDPATETYAGAFVPLGRKYALASGLMEITYRSGAKVILEGPCCYEVESAAGGFLALGKLTARVGTGGGGRGTGEKRRSEVRDQRSEKANPKSQIPNHKSEIINHKSSSPQPPTTNPLFAVRTPTAIVTDLGTEFGVEVALNGDTTSHVFQGKVVVKAGNRGFGDSGIREANNHKSEIINHKSVVLAAGQSARVEKDVATADARIVTGENVGIARKFVRRIYEPPKVLDLLDVVAGGNGSGRRRDCGIDPASGRFESTVTNDRRASDGEFRAVVGNRMVDGVFIPNGGHGLVQVDSVGDTFDGFPQTTGRTWGPLWARAADNAPVGLDDDAKSWIFLIDNIGQFTPEKCGLLCLHANAAVTFNLETMRMRHRGSRPERFRATAGLVDSNQEKRDADYLADIWVVVDGRLKLKRIGLRRRDGAVHIDVEIAPSDRFLTLAATDGGDGITADWVVFGDPILKMISSGTEK